jgi:serine/threonine protein kinase
MPRGDMSLNPATKLGPYEILQAIGAGGMGEVYRARDITLNREVAIKMIPATYAGDPDRLRVLHYLSLVPLFLCP